MNETLITLNKYADIILPVIYNEPEQYWLTLRGKDVIANCDHASPKTIGVLNMEAVPSVVLPWLKIKSFKLEKLADDKLSLFVNLVM